LKQIAFATITLLALTQTASAQVSWSSINFSSTPSNAPAVMAAADSLMNSAVGKEFPGKLLLQVAVADGADPTTHTFVPIHKSLAEGEAFGQKLQADPAWATFQAEMTRLSQPVSRVLYRTIKNWGELADSDHVWMAHAFAVKDASGFLAALNKLMASPTGKKFPGQVYLSEIIAGGISPATHVISVGFTSQAEMEAWNVTRDASTDWAAYIRASRSTGDYLGASLYSDLKTWGPATFSALSGN